MQSRAVALLPSGRENRKFSLFHGTTRTLRSQSHAPLFYVRNKCVGVGRVFTTKARWLYLGRERSTRRPCLSIDSARYPHPIWATVAITRSHGVYQIYNRLIENIL